MVVTAIIHQAIMKIEQSIITGHISRCVMYAISVIYRANPGDNTVLVIYARWQYCCILHKPALRTNLHARQQPGQGAISTNLWGSDLEND